MDFFRTYLSLCERLFRLCHVPHAATLTTICSFFAKCAATGGKRIPKMFRLKKFQSTFKPYNSLEQLKSASLQSTYSKQKCSLHTEFEKFLASLPNSKTILSACPTDINRFLAWKDWHGKTIVHSDGCSDSHLQSTANCKCPKRLAFKTVDSYIGKLRAIFKETGRGGKWNSMLGLGNPAASPEVQKYLKASTEEQLQAGITPKQAVPLLLPKLLLLARFLNRKIAAHSIKVSATLKIAIFPHLRFQHFQIGMLESFLLKKKSEENIISVERYRG